MSYQAAFHRRITSHAEKHAPHYYLDDNSRC